MSERITFVGRELTLLDRDELSGWLKNPTAEKPVVYKALTTSKVAHVDRSNRVIQQIISSDRKDRDGDVVDPNGWDWADWLNNPVVMWGHDYHGLPIARGLDVRTEKNLVVSAAQFPREGMYPFADQVFELTAEGFCPAASVGFVPDEAEPLEKDGEVSGWHFTKQSLLEWSKVAIPSNPEALARAIARGIADPNILAKGGWIVPREVIDLSRYKDFQVTEKAAMPREPRSLADMHENAHRMHEEAVSAAAHDEGAEPDVAEMHTLSHSTHDGLEHMGLPMDFAFSDVERHFEPAETKDADCGCAETEEEHYAKAPHAVEKWNGPAAMSRCAKSKNPASCFKAICAGRRDGDASEEKTWALPHHDAPGDGPDPAGVRNALSRLPQTQGLINAGAAKKHLQAHLNAMRAAGDITEKEFEDLTAEMDEAFEKMSPSGVEAAHRLSVPHQEAGADGGGEAAADLAVAAARIADLEAENVALRNAVKTQREALNFDRNSATATEPAAEVKETATAPADEPTPERVQAKVSAAVAAFVAKCAEIGIDRETTKALTMAFVRELRLH